jgi:hypothetical protein
MAATFYPSGSIMATWLDPNHSSSMPNLKKAISVGAVSCVLLAGRNPACPTASLGDIWAYPAIAAGQTVRVLPTVGYTMAVVSDNVNDTAAGTGARTIAVAYLTTDYKPHTALFTLNGQTPVTVATSIDGGAGGTITTALRQNGFEVYSAGSGNANAGNIFITDSSNTYAAGVPVTTTLVYDCMLAGDNVDGSSQYTIPVGYYGAVVQLIPSINDITATPKFGRVRVQQSDGDAVFHGFDLGGLSSNTNPVPLNPACVPLLQPQSEIRIQAQVSATTEVACLNFLILWPVTL